MQFKKYINKINDLKKSGIISKGDKILLAFSGGPDSIFSYYILSYLQEEYGLEIALLYINHNLREDIQKDLDIVTKFAENHRLDLYIEEINVIDYARKNKKSIELAARELRYKIYNEVLMKIEYDKISTGHNLDDNVETMFFRLIRGTTLEGLRGIPQQRGNIIRPILYFEKKDILDFLDENNVEYVIDYTNKENDYMRNYIRNVIFPSVEKINPRFKQKAISLMEEIKGAGDPRGKLKLRDLLKEHGIEISREKINSIYSAICDKKGNKSFDLGNNKILLKEYGNIRIVEKENEKENNKDNNKENEKEKILEKNSVAEWGEYKIGYFGKNSVGEISDGFKNYQIYLIDKNIEKLKLRSKRDGDRILLKNLGYKKLKKIFIDEKIPKWDREKIPVILGNLGNPEEMHEEILLVGNIKARENVYKTVKNKIDMDKNILIVGRKNG